MSSNEKIKKDSKFYGSVQYTKISEDEVKGPSKPAAAAPIPTVPYSRLFRFADWNDKLALSFGLLFAVIHGGLAPLFPVVFGQMVNAFDPSVPEESLRASVKQSSLSFLVIACAAFLTSYGQLTLMLLSSQRQALKIRKLYLRSLFRQEIGWYDVNDSGELLTHVAGDALLIQEGIGEKLGTFVQFISMFIGGFVTGFVYSWKMSLVILSVTPLLVISGGFLRKLVQEFSTRSQAAYAKAGGVAEEVISCIRTVAAFSGEKSEIARYGERIAGVLKEGEKTGHIVGLGLGITFGIMFASYGLAFWYGSKLIESGEMEAGDVTTVFFAITFGSMALGQASPNIASFVKARGAAVHVFEVIDRVPKIDSLSDEGRSPEHLKGNISFSKVHFTYPSRPDAKILKGIDLEVTSGKTIALVGASGCGKSTVVGLIQRFYDSESGSVTLDGVPIAEYSVKWLRSQIGVVSQEPILFAKSIRENIAFGRENVSMQEIEAAAKKANAHSFITRLPAGYETLVGERGAQLSGGQKQRVAIARAIVRDPKILLLDEATSALDSESEKLVQAALDEASKGRTTVIVAHRLSTIRNADSIFVFDNGVIAEQGTHGELMEKQGIYFQLVERQTVKAGEQAELGTQTKPERERAVLKRRSTKITEEEKEVEEKKEKLKTDGVVWRSMKLNLTEWPFIVVGFFGSIGAGVIFPLYSFIFSAMLNDLLFLRGEELEAAALYWGIAFLILGGFTALSNYLQVAMFSISGERLTERMRNMLFRGIVRQNVGWFDDKANSTGILTTKLNNDASKVKGATGQSIGTVVQTLATIVSGLGISLWACWQLALAITAVVPLIGASGVFRMKMMIGFNSQLKKAYEDSGHIASEAIENIRTVSSLGRHENFIRDYSDALDAPEKQGTRSAWISGATFGFSEMTTSLIWAFAFWYGTELVLAGKTEFQFMMRAISAVVFGAQRIGQSMALAPDFSEAKVAAASIYEIVDRVPPIDHFSNEGTRLEKVHGEVEFSNVVFSYPTRPEVKILKGLSLTVKSGETLALVGSSGCGKSTVVSLLERFYLPESGHILLDGIETSSLNVNWLRHQIGVVGQEPVLFATTIRENIAYGKPDATEDEIVEAAKKANAHSFITLLPAGYNTLVGEKGSQLSGGQKQRVAIARALVRNPKILLLDEATSALDAESEKVVQEALDRASEGRTTIVIAHRLSTIKNASCIAVIDQGRVVEKGTHNELMSNNGLYHSLVLTQVNPL